MPKRYSVIKQGEMWRIYDSDKGKWWNHPGWKNKALAVQECAAMNKIVPRDIKKPKGK